MEGIDGVIVIEFKTAFVTVRVVAEEVTAPNVADMFVVPAEEPKAIPWVPFALLIVALFVLEEFQVT